MKLRRETTQTIWRTVVFAGAMLGAPACAKQAQQPTTPSPANTATNTPPGPQAGAPTTTNGNGNGNGTQMVTDDGKMTKAPTTANPCGGDANPCGGDAAPAPRPRGADDDGGGGMGRGFVLS